MDENLADDEIENDLAPIVVQLAYVQQQEVLYPALRRCDKPMRVDHYFSSWVIGPLQSRKGNGVLSSCEVTLLHCEDMGIPRDVAKLGVRHGMWGTVKNFTVGSVLIKVHENKTHHFGRVCFRNGLLE